MGWLSQNVYFLPTVLSTLSLNPFDLAILTALNQFARHSWLFDRLVNFWSHEHLLKGGVLVAVLWWAWFRPGADQAGDRRRVVVTVAGTMVALGLGKLCQLACGFRPRPIHVHELGFVVPYGMSSTVLDGWSSFPSDHAILFGAVSAGLFLISRRAGLLVLAYSLIMVLLPRAYLLLHYPTDLIAGLLIGAATVVAAQRYLLRARAVECVVAWADSRPALAYPLMFLVSFQIAVLFDNVRAIAIAVAKAFGPQLL